MKSAPQQEGGVHRLKTWPEYFALVKSGLKPFEIRKNDRDYKVGDVLALMEWSPKTKQYTGRDLILRRVTSIVQGGQFGIRKGYCVMGLKSMRKPK